MNIKYKIFELYDSPKLQEIEQEYFYLERPKILNPICLLEINNYNYLLDSLFISLQDAKIELKKYLESEKENNYIILKKQYIILPIYTLE